MIQCFKNHLRIQQIALHLLLKQRVESVLRRINAVNVQSSHMDTVDEEVRIQKIACLFLHQITINALHSNHWILLRQKRNSKDSSDWNKRDTVNRVDCIA